MLQRVLLSLVIGALAAGAALVFDAAGATALSLELLRQARTNDSPVVARRLLDRADAALTQTWSKATLWHAGAAEARSAILATRAELEENDRELFQASRDEAVRAAGLSPIQPNARIRLAALDEAGLPNPLCDRRACLERAFEEAPVMEFESACVRLELAHRAGALRAQDSRFLSFIKTAPSERRALSCLARFLPADESFALVLSTRRAREN